MSIFIKGMDMPTEGTVIAIYKLNGKFYASVHGTELCPLIPVPTPHGRLKDVDRLIEKRWDADTRCGYVQVVDVGDIENAPTVIPVEEGE